MNAPQQPPSDKAAPKKEAPKKESPKKETSTDKAIDDMQKKVEERLLPKLQEAKERLDETNSRLKGFIRQNPGACLLGAGLLGFAIGRWASRR